ncbi:hypothetical protein [Paenibacillus turpanensis]|uniref:hypothetical protein n=1 Tax=Paenibacillus turpanensis TaxID=2689078 RepID=UPI00140CABCF|nr:hypothetical protein [Paenibacillus turpanensis]
MILLPQTFNENDWFVLISLLIAYAGVLRLPRLFPRTIAILVMFFSLTLAKGADNTLGVKPLDLYDTNEIPKFDLTDMLTWAIYPAAGYLFIYLYHRLRLNGMSIAVFIVLCSLFGIAFEAVCVYFNVFHYKGWTLLYSFITYLIVQSLTLLLFEYLQRHYKEHKKRNSKNMGWRRSG